MITTLEILARFEKIIYAPSLVIQAGAAFWMQRTPGGKRLAMLAHPDAPVLRGFDGEMQPFGQGYSLKLCPLDSPNARALRHALPHLQPRPLGLITSAGMGDRLGLATPGHVQALHSVQNVQPTLPRAGFATLSATILPIFAQQSIREMTRTRRTPEQVITDATWGAFQAGWSDVVGADADHLKTPEDIPACVQAGFALFTVDPGAYVDAQSAAGDLSDALRGLPWDELESSQADLERRYAGKTLDLGDRILPMPRRAVLGAAVKYGKAVAHVVRMYRSLACEGVPFELEVSVDETDTPTTPVEHAYVASELRRLGVKWVSLAPRFVGRFEKGVDYIGDLAALEQDLDWHAAIARSLGPYKLSLHSGSDKFSVYPLITRATGGLVHLKTAGTSYLEALRAAAQQEPAFFRQLAALAVERYPADRASYHVSAELGRFPALASLSDADLPGLLDQFDAREILHVTFGSILDRFGVELMAFLQSHEEAYYAALEKHFIRHLQPFKNW